MRYESIRARNIGPFRDLDLDLAAIRGTLVAVTGDNGEGKSTLLELLPGAIYRSCPTRGTLVDLATDRDAFVEVKVINGKPYTIRQSADPISKKSESLIYSDGGALALRSAKVREADAFVARHFPQPEVEYSSGFLPQGRRGFLDLSAAERKGVILRMLGIERLEALAERARDHARNAKAAHQTALARLTDAQSAYPSIESATEEHTAATQALETAELTAQHARDALAESKAHAEQVARCRERHEQRAALYSRIGEADKHIAELSERIRNNRMLLAREAEIRAAAEAHAAWSAKELDAGKALAQADVDHAKRAGAAQNAEQKLTRAEGALSKAEARLDQHEARIKDAAAIERAVKALPSLRKAEKEASAHVDELEQQIEDAEDTSHDDSDLRISQLRGGLESIRDGAKSPKNVATIALLGDDALVERASAGPTKAKTLRKELTAAKHTLAKASRLASANAEIAARAKDLKAARQLLEDAEREVNALKAEVQEARGALQTAKEHAKTAQRARAAADKARAACAARIAEVETDATLLAKLDLARDRLELLDPELTRAAEQRARDDQALAALPPLDAPKSSVTVDQRERQVVIADTDLRSAHKRLASAAEKLTAAETGASTLAAREADVTAAQSELSDWTRLGQDLGKDGVQALEIDAAIPEINTLANDLLHTCHGTRFTVELRTDRLSSDGKRTLEDLDVRVVDTEHGRDAAVETFSGGECVIVGEALSLALTMLACKRAGYSRPTLVRDESGAALDPKNGRAYIAMLRRAAELLDADKVLFVTHTPELQELADARIVVGNGTARIDA